NKKMAHRRSVSLQNHYFQLEEAVNSIIAAKDLNAYEFLNIPPDPDATTDEEEGPEDDLVTQALPRNVSGTVEVVRRRRLSLDGDSSDNEPLLTYASTKKIYSTPHEVNNAIETRVILFEKLFHQQMCNLIVEHFFVCGTKPAKKGMAFNLT
ncbi:hypothetical protein HHI36_005679, partial [Cryptolaemus montrouzieri]